MALAIVPNRTGGGLPFFNPEDPSMLPMGQAPMPQPAPQPAPQMAAASTQSPSGGILGFLQNPDNQAKMMALGQGMSQLAVGQAPNIAANPAYQAMMQRRQDADQRKQMGGLLDGIPPEMRRVLAQMPPQLAQKVILEYTMKKMAPPEPEEGIVIDGRLVGKTSGRVIYEGSPGSGMTTAMQTLDQRARAAGLEPGTPQYQQFIMDGGSKSGLEIVSDGKGGFTVRQGNIAGDPTDVTSPSSPAAMISSIDGILNDPALDFATGWLSWTQNIPGTASRRFGARANQLQGQAFLQAYRSLKGSGQITEIEGAKATQAIGRLDTAQSPEDYRAALTELRDILELGMSRPEGWVDSQGQTAPSSGTMSDEDLLKMYGG